MMKNKIIISFLKDSQITSRLLLAACLIVVLIFLALLNNKQQAHLARLKEQKELAGKIPELELKLRNPIADFNIILTGIIMDGGTRIAIINGIIVKVGDSVGEYKIINIEPNAVILNKDGKESILRMKE